MSFLHGIEVVELSGGPRPIETSKSAVIGLVGTAPQGPVNVPTLIAGSRKEAVAIFGEQDGVSTIPDALDAIFDQIGAAVVVINVLSQTEAAEKDYTFAADEDALTLDHTRAISSTVVVKDSAGTTTYTADVDYTVYKGVVTKVAGGGLDGVTTIKVSYKYTDPSTLTLSAVSGGVDAVTGDYTGVQALLAAESVVHLPPRLLIAPGFTCKESDTSTPTAPAFEPGEKNVVSDLLTVAERLRAVVIADGPNSNDSAAKAYRNQFDSPRLFMVDPYVKVFSPVTNEETTQPASARVAGIIAKSDNKRGFWYSPSNRPVSGITGTARAIDFTMGDNNARANLLNENHVCTIIHQDGYRLWGNRTCCSDKKWMFLSVRRTADMINDALMRNHLWAVDENITASYLESVTRGVNNFLRHLKSIGAIIGGECWADPEINTPDQIQLGRVTFDFDFTPPYPAERLTFRSRLVNNYLKEIL